MSHDLICSWLGLPPDSWPPNYYVLLGLEPGETNLELIEQRVQERLGKLRPYQMNYPDQATEALNCVARAFSCLIDPNAKKAYDAELKVQPAGPPAAPVTPPPPTHSTPVSIPAPDPADPLAWLFGPWSQPRAREERPVKVEGPGAWKTAPPPPRLPVEAAAVPVPAPAAPEANGNPPANPPAAPPAPEAAAPPAPPPEPIDPIIHEAQASSSARRGLGTRRALYKRAAITRQMLGAWERAGRYLNRPTRRFTRLAEDDLVRQLTLFRQLLPGFPPLLGQVGQPGQYILPLAQQLMIRPTLRALLPDQRKKLADDWVDVRRLLVAHRTFLRQELRSLRQKSIWALAGRAVHTFITDYSGAVLLGLGLVTLVLALLFSWSR